MTVNHIEGTVAPITKTIIYHTVKNLLSEISKCWITSSLGADHSASALDDASEQSAGWYWQFNRMQGFKHDGITRTPGNDWISIINENSEWVLENDPCTHELGNDWRIPTSTEWQNVINDGDWNDLDDSWNSGLKMHAAGYLTRQGCVLMHRGIDATYWSASQ